jgi:hypothetical protein
VKGKHYSRQFHRMTVERMRTRAAVAELAQELRAIPRFLCNWHLKLQMVEFGEESARPSTHESSYGMQVLSRGDCERKRGPESVGGCA